MNPFWIGFIGGLATGASIYFFYKLFLFPFLEAHLDNHYFEERKEDDK